MIKSFFRTTIIAASALLFINCAEGDDPIYIYPDEEGGAKSYEKVITDYGAVGDGDTDCSDIINKLIEELPASGGVIIIPEGDFVLDKPIVVKRNYVTIKGVNPGIRSNIDVDIDGLLGPGGGSKLILRNASYGIHVPILPDVGGRKNRISGVEIKDLLISGGTSNRGTGIYVQQDNDGCRISNIIGINLNFGISATNADAMIIRDCWISEVANSIVMSNGIQNMITNCQLGAQPSGVTCKLKNQENFVFSANHVYPDGKSNLVAENCSYLNITGNNFQSYFTGVIELKGDNNLISSNIFWLRESTSQTQKAADYGVIRVEGNYNQVSNSIVKCDWHSGVSNPVTVRSVAGQANSFNNLTISDMSSSRTFFVNETTRIIDCVPAENVVADGNKNNVYIRY